MDANLYPYLPSIISIYLLAISNLAGLSLKDWLSDVDVGTGLAPGPSERRAHIQNIALDWSTRVTFYNAIGMALVSVVSLYAESRNYVLATGIMLFIVLVILLPIILWFNYHRPGELVAIKFNRINMMHGTLPKLILIGINLIIMLAIFVVPRAAPK